MDLLSLWIVAVACAAGAYAVARGLRQGLLLSVVLLLLFIVFARAGVENVRLGALVAAHLLVALAGVVGYAARRRRETR